MNIDFPIKNDNSSNLYNKKEDVPKDSLGHPLFYMY